MNEFEEKYKMFGLNDEMIKSFQNYSIGIDGNRKESETFTITTIVIENTGIPTKSLEKNNAKLV